MVRRNNIDLDEVEREKLLENLIGFYLIMEGVYCNIAKDTVKEVKESDYDWLKDGVDVSNSDFLRGQAKRIAKKLS